MSSDSRAPDLLCVVLQRFELTNGDTYLPANVAQPFPQALADRLLAAGKVKLYQPPPFHPRGVMR